MRTRTLWLGFAGVVALSFLLLGYLGVRIYQEMPPVPEHIVTTSGVAVIETG